nr:hypothetical protein [uncultured Undibacterium sp.]
MINTINNRYGMSTDALNPSKQYPENLSKIADSADERSSSYGKYSNQQILAVSEKLNQREQAAFGYLGHDASTAGIIRYAKAYISYIDSLSPEEQNGVRYQGTKDNMSTLLNQANAQFSSEINKPNGADVEYKSLLSMLLDEMNKQLQQNGIGKKNSSSEHKNTDVVTISNAGRRLSSDESS